jgi:hypothetical protein
MTMLPLLRTQEMLTLYTCTDSMYALLIQLLLTAAASVEQVTHNNCTIGLIIHCIVIAAPQ